MAENDKHTSLLNNGIHCRNALNLDTITKTLADYTKKYLQKIYDLAQSEKHTSLLNNSIYCRNIKTRLLVVYNDEHARLVHGHTNYEEKSFEERALGPIVNF